MTTFIEKSDDILGFHVIAPIKFPTPKAWPWEHEAWDSLVIFWYWCHPHKKGY
jgi:hypothetical protein